MSPQHLQHSLVPMLVEEWENIFVGLVDLFPFFCSGEDYLSASENQKHNLGLIHAENETRE